MPNDSAYSPPVTQAEVERLWEESRQAVLRAWAAQQEAHEKVRRFEAAFLLWIAEEGRTDRGVAAGQRGEK